MTNPVIPPKSVICPVCKATAAVKETWAKGKHKAVYLDNRD